MDDKTEQGTETPETNNVPPHAAAPEAVIKRGRGRPRKVPVADGATPVPVSAAAPSKRRGRPPKRTAAYSDEEKNSLARQITGLHLIAAKMTGIPEIEISPPEAVCLAEAVANVSSEYGLSMSGKTGAMVQLIATAAMIYAPRFGAIKKRINEKKNTTSTPNIEPNNAASVN